MTCQWCIHYRRRGGNSLCLAPEGNGKTMAVGARDANCVHFSARKSCTTCGRRCTPDEKDALALETDSCPKWELRVLSSWGGSRRFVRKSNPSIPTENTQTQEVTP